MGEPLDWNRVQAFLASAEEGSFSKAARRLAISQPTVGRQVSALETELGVVLFARTGRRLTLTDAGEELLSHARTMGHAARALALAATRQSEELVGTVRISASDLITAHLIGPALLEIRRLHPAITLDLVATNAISDLMQREADIAVRHVRPTEPELVARKIVDGGAAMYASPRYLDQVGPLRTVEDLSRAELVGYDRGDALIRALADRGLTLTPEHFPVVTMSSLVQWELGKRGLGIVLAIEAVGDREPGLVRVLPELPLLPVPIWLVCHRELETTRRFRVVFDALARTLANRMQRR